jgi:hypothetical protein
MKNKALFLGLLASGLTLLVCAHYTRPLRQSASEGTMPEAANHRPERPQPLQLRQKARGDERDEGKEEDDALARERWEL